MEEERGHTSGKCPYAPERCFACKPTSSGAFKYHLAKYCWTLNPELEPAGKKRSADEQQSNNAKKRGGGDGGGRGGRGGGGGRDNGRGGGNNGGRGRGGRDTGRGNKFHPARLTTLRQSYEDSAPYFPQSEQVEELGGDGAYNQLSNDVVSKYQPVAHSALDGTALLAEHGDWRVKVPAEKMLCAWMDALCHVETAEQREWNFHLLPQYLEHADHETKSIPLCYMAYFARLTYNDSQLAWRYSAELPPMELILECWNNPETIHSNGFNKLVVPKFHDSDTDRGIQGRPRTKFPEPAYGGEPNRKCWYRAFMTKVSNGAGGAKAPSEDFVFVDSCAARNVEESTRYLADAVPNTDPNLGVRAIDGICMGATHTAYNAATGNTLVVPPGVDAALASVAELTRHNNSVHFETDGSMIITAANGLKVTGHCNADNIYQISRADYQKLQDNNVQHQVSGTHAPSISHSKFANTFLHKEALMKKSTGVSRAAALTGVQPGKFTAEQLQRAEEVRNLHRCNGHISYEKLTIGFKQWCHYRYASNCKRRSKHEGDIRCLPSVPRRQDNKAQLHCI